MPDSMLGGSGEDHLGLVIDFAQKLKSGAIDSMDAKRYLRGENRWFRRFIPINRKQSFDAAQFFGREGVSVASENPRSLALSELDVSRVRIKSYWSSGEGSIRGVEKINRFRQTKLIPFDAKIAATLLAEERQQTLELLHVLTEAGTILCIGTIFEDGWVIGLVREANHQRWVWSDFHISASWAGNSIQLAGVAP